MDRFPEKSIGGDPPARLVVSTLDGFGRTVKVENGDGSGTKSAVESVYGPCACSPLGKLIHQAMTHAPGAPKIRSTVRRRRLHRDRPPGHARRRSACGGIANPRRDRRPLSLTAAGNAAA